MKAKEIKGILVHFYREATQGDYLDALYQAIEEIKGLESKLSQRETPKLPTHEELESHIDTYLHEDRATPDYASGFEAGARWVRFRILSDKD